MPDLEFFNGLGGFADDGREYVTILAPGSVDAGAVDQRHSQSELSDFQVGADGGGYTWSVNSRENQLTPWSNDPVGDPPGRGVLSARHRGSGDLWSADAANSPIRHEDATIYLARHGRGYSRFDAHWRMRSAVELVQFVRSPIPVKISRLRACTTDRSKRVRTSVGHRLRANGFWAHRITSLRDVRRPPRSMPCTGAMLRARNPWSIGPSVQRVAFAMTWRGRQERLDRRPAGVHRAQWNASPRRRRLRSDAPSCPSRHGAGLRPLRRAADRSSRVAAQRRGGRP